LRPSLNYRRDGARCASDTKEAPGERGESEPSLSAAFHNRRSTIISLTWMIALAGLRPLGQVWAQFMIVWQRGEPLADPSTVPHRPVGIRSLTHFFRHGFTSFMSLDENKGFYYRLLEWEHTCNRDTKVSDVAIAIGRLR
jgi:hypothetical protein